MNSREVFESEENKLLEESNIIPTTTSTSSVISDSIIDDDAVALLEGDYDNDTNKDTKNGCANTYSNSFFNYDEEFELDYSEDELLRDDEPIVSDKNNSDKSNSDKKDTDLPKEEKKNDNESNKDEKSIDESNSDNKATSKKDEKDNVSGSKKNKTNNGKRNPIVYSGSASKKSNKHYNNKKRNFEKGPRYDKSKVILRTSFVGPGNGQPLVPGIMTSNQGYQNPGRFNGPQLISNNSFNGFSNINPFGPGTTQQPPIIGINQRSGLPQTSIMGNNPFGPNPGMGFANKNMVNSMGYNQPRSMIQAMTATAPITGINMMGYQYSGQMLPQNAYTSSVVINPTMQIDWSKLADEFSGVTEGGNRSGRKSRYSSCSSYSSSDSSRRSRSSRNSSSDSSRRHRKRKSSRKSRKNKKKDSKRRSRSRSYSSDKKRRDDRRKKDRSQSEEKKKKDKSSKKINPTLECAKIVGVDKDYLRKVEQQNKLREEVLRKKRNNEKIDPNELKIEELNPENILKAYLVVSIKPSSKTWSFGNPKEKLTVIAKSVGKIKKVWKKGDKTICVIFDSHDDATKFSRTYDGKTVNGTTLDVRLDKCRLILSKIS
uniref:RRM domain-containing protein n=1 Tax=Strongyloides stercoralis TaxID=6248 RepID=A0A0K0DT56_STRER